MKGGVLEAGREQEKGVRTWGKSDGTGAAREERQGRNMEEAWVRLLVMSRQGRD